MRSQEFRELSLGVRTEEAPALVGGTTPTWSTGQLNPEDWGRSREENALVLEGSWKVLEAGGAGRLHPRKERGKQEETTPSQRLLWDKAASPPITPPSARPDRPQCDLTSAPAGGCARNSSPTGAAEVASGPTDSVASAGEPLLSLSAASGATTSLDTASDAPKPAYR